jgi:hypothetical protein
VRCREHWCHLCNPEEGVDVRWEVGVRREEEMDGAKKLGERLLRDEVLMEGLGEVGYPIPIILFNMTF